MKTHNPVLGILKKPVPKLTLAQQETLARADTIRRRTTPGGQLREQINELRDYVAVSKHSPKTKIKNLRAALEKASPRLKQEIIKSIEHLERK